jgi:hypothetical protein
MPIAHYWKIRGGKVAHYIGLLDTAATLAAMSQGGERSGKAGGGR